jgi:hypothetical protein
MSIEIRDRIDTNKQLITEIEQEPDSPEKAEFLQELRSTIEVDLAILEKNRSLREQQIESSKQAKQALAALALREANPSDERVVVKENDPHQAVYKASSDEITWLPGDRDVAVTLMASDEGKQFWFGDLSSKANRTNIGRRFRKEAVEEAQEIVADHIKSKLDAADAIAIELRPLEKGDTRDRTTLNPYKDDDVVPSGEKPNNVRVLVLEDTKAAELPVFLFASMCTHAEQENLIYNI